MTTTHNLKTWKEFFISVLHGDKTFEVRKNDRDFKVGDILNLIEVDPNNDMKPTGRTCKREVTYILTGEQWGIMEGYAVLGIK